MTDVPVKPNGPLCCLVRRARISESLNPRGEDQVRFRSEIPEMMKK
jgi:hypothetical protein